MKKFVIETGSCLAFRYASGTHQTVLGTCIECALNKKSRFRSNLLTCLAEVLRLGSNVRSLEMRSIASEVSSFSVPAVRAVSVCQISDKLKISFNAQRAGERTQMTKHDGENKDLLLTQQQLSTQHQYPWWLQYTASEIPV